MDQDSPRFDRAMVDGFALHWQDARPDIELELVGHIDAGGAVFSGVVQPGQCVAINTGGVVPAGADAVLMVEHSQKVVRGEKEFVITKTSLPPGAGIQKQGSDAKAGDVVLSDSVTLGPAQIALCAAAGIGMPQARRARIAVLATGDELVDTSASGASGTRAALEPGQIWNSNGPMLCALATQAGAEVLDLGTCRDDERLLRDIISRGLTQADLLVVSGGMSMGTRDWVPVILKQLGARLHVEKVRIKPGKPFLLGTVQIKGQEKYVAGLPGNPVSSFVTFQRFVREMIARMTGLARPASRILPAQSASALPANGDREFYQPCTLRQQNSTLVADVLAWKGSADLFTLARADGLLIRPAGAPEVPAGGPVDILIWT
jgi:molybdopterin molybdotransferase